MDMYDFVICVTICLIIFIGLVSIPLSHAIQEDSPHLLLSSTENNTTYNYSQTDNVLSNFIERVVFFIQKSGLINKTHGGEYIVE